jgi:hypothetical protein
MEYNWTKTQSTTILQIAKHFLSAVYEGRFVSRAKLARGTEKCVETTCERHDSSEKNR